ncbi:hypothetical protein PI172_2345 [Prevotella intermedia]|uniref:Uncharacterized protein n=1 Tax=Prevotella intermedia TaxID=28131 RepID=A0AAD1BKN8_PREIN|nr:hypothetical protein PI172_2345 [Prevotella intermedia]
MANQNFVEAIYFTKYFRTFVLVSRNDNCLPFFALQKGKVGTVFAQ